MIATLFEGWGAHRRAWRRARNLRAAARAGNGAQRGAQASPLRRSARLHAGPGVWLGAAACVLVAAGAIVIASHARGLGAAVASGGQAGGNGRPLASFQPALPGLAFSVPAQPGVVLGAQPGGALLILAGMRAGQPTVIDLCSQTLEGTGGRLAPVRIGYRFADVARWVARNEGAASPVTIRNVVLSGSSMPRVDITGVAGAALQLAWHGESARWVGDATHGGIVSGGRGQAALGRDGWLVWGEEGALRLTRRASAACPQAGELVLTPYRAAPGLAATALVAAFPETGAVRSATLAPGAYRVPAAAPARLEDGALFDSLLAHGLVRLGQGGMIEAAPRDLAGWRAAAPAQRTADLGAWDGVLLDEAGRRLLERLYGRADGAYVREQIRIFNAERRLLAWRVRPGAPGAWQAAAGGVAVSLDAPLPLAASRLFERLPEGWAPWQRVADWPAGATGARLALTLAQPASGAERVNVLLAGRVRGVEGARLETARPACGGRACVRSDDVSELVLAPVAGSRRIVIDAAPLDLAGMAGQGDAAWRHLRVENGRLAWKPLVQPPRATPAIATTPVLLADRKGRPLWQSGSATQPAQAAGLASLLGLHEEHASSIAGMLARLPAPEGRAHAATLSLDLDLQRASQDALACVGLRRGSWDGAHCRGGAAPPSGRQAGLVLLDAGNGDILAAASAGGGVAPSTPWAELRDFDRVDPARSPLRQAALQHDGGAERSPGSTFKIVSALGLELAAQRDPRLDALLQGMPLAAIDTLARERGFAFRSGAATYPASGGLTHITNFRNGTLERRAQDGKLGLAQALTWSLNTWFAWTAELGDASLFGKSSGGAPSLRALHLDNEPDAMLGVRPIADMAQRLGFGRALALDGGLLPAGHDWRRWDALQASAAGIDPIGSRHELRQMAIGLRMQATPLHMAMVAGAVGEGRAIAPRLLINLDGRAAQARPGAPLGVRLDRVRAGLHGVVAQGTAAGAFRAPEFDGLRTGLYGKTGTAPSGPNGEATVWFTGWLEPGSIPGQTRRLAFAAFVSRSEATGGEHAAPVVAALLRSMLVRKGELKEN
ncbi:penicillin-binding transpeptidase domain-containing protein [Massilia niabensis]|uniref:Penicillin-binding transpeptidase domain-containing protein n=1 Tax=Massilia niabensis TaxID=544910 RepID=A0ABW0KZG2_9BURK